MATSDKYQADIKIDNISIWNVDDRTNDQGGIHVRYRLIQIYKEIVLKYPIHQSKIVKITIISIMED